jgi:polo-like kinase 1
MATAPDPAVPKRIQHVSQDGMTHTYTFLQRVGSGGFATVYSALEEPDGVRYAIKCTSKARFARPRVKDKLISEIEIHKELHHRHIVEFMGVCQDDDFVYILLQFCPGGTLLDLLRRESRFSEHTTAGYCRQILEALAYIHKRRIVHRDLKPQNLLIAGDGLVKLSDFGLSVRLSDDSNERHRSICGTPGYMSPEVVAGSYSRTRAIDIWALGVCAFMMLTGYHPFRGSNREETSRCIKHVQYSWPSSVLFSNSSRAFVDSLLRRNPSERPSASLLLEHPFIQQLHPAPLAVARVFPKSISFQTLRPVIHDQSLGLPPFAVKLWWDYSRRYGLGYILMNGVCGVCFNDSSRMVVSSDGSFTQYWESPKAIEMEICDPNDDDSPLKKKMLLMQRFRTELVRRAGDAEVDSDDVQVTDQPLKHVKYWARTEKGILFRMADRDVQANFRDHTKIVMERSTKRIFFVNGPALQVVSVKDIKEGAPNPAIMERLADIREMATHLA